MPTLSARSGFRIETKTLLHFTSAALIPKQIEDNYSVGVISSGYYQLAILPGDVHTSAGKIHMCERHTKEIESYRYRFEQTY